jgi:hypothetical protein
LVFENRQVLRLAAIAVPYELKVAIARRGWPIDAARPNPGRKQGRCLAEAAPLTSKLKADD